jgi:hypothetical protein
MLRWKCVRNLHLSGVYEEDGLGRGLAPIEVVKIGEGVGGAEGFDAPHVVGGGELLPVRDGVEGGVGGRDFRHDGFAVVGSSQVVCVPAEGVQKLGAARALRVQPEHEVDAERVEEVGHGRDAAPGQAEVQPARERGARALEPGRVLVLAPEEVVAAPDAQHGPGGPARPVALRHRFAQALREVVRAPGRDPGALAQLVAQDSVNVFREKLCCPHGRPVERRRLLGGDLRQLDARRDVALVDVHGLHEDRRRSEVHVLQPLREQLQRRFVVLHRRHVHIVRVLRAAPLLHALRQLQCNAHPPAKTMTTTTLTSRLISKTENRNGTEQNHENNANLTISKTETSTGRNGTEQIHEKNVNLTISKLRTEMGPNYTCGRGKRGARGGSRRGRTMGCGSVLSLSRGGRSGCTRRL